MSMPSYVIAIAPSTPSRFPDLFVSGEASLAQMLERPKGFRQYGWDMTTLDQARIMGGEFLEVRNGDRKTLRVYEDGSFIARASVDPTFLAWGSGEHPEEHSLVLHPLAVIEFTAAFFHLYSQLAKHLDTKPEAFSVKVALADARPDGKPLLAVPYQVGSIGWMFKKGERFPVSAENVEKEFVIDAAEVLDDPDRAAARALDRLFLFFGIASDKIPYLKTESRVRRVDVEAIKGVR